MSSGQSGLGDYGVTVPQSPPPGRGSSGDGNAPKLGFETTPPAPSLAEDVAAAREVDWIVFTGRYPYVFDAARLGFGIGHREDSSYQWTPDEVRLPVHFLDNDYESPNLQRFVDRAFEYEPEIAVLGDIYEPGELDAHLDVADELWGSFPDMELMLVPKCGDVLEDIPSDFVLGYANGASPVQATDIAPHREWRAVDNQLHILGGTPLSAYDEIVSLTKEWVTGEPPADIVGLDWNGYQRYAENHGDYAAADGGWHRNLRDAYIPKRDLVRYSLLNAKHFWVSKGVWPDSDVEELPARDELRAANRGRVVPAQDDADRCELAMSPLPSNQRHQTPVYRTDSTQAEIIEPLSPLASVLGAQHWTPSGAFTGETKFSSPRGHHTEVMCTGCGAHIFAEPTACAGMVGQSNHSERPDPLDVQVVSYEHQSQVEDHNYDSVPQEGPAALASTSRFPQIHAFCSERCRMRAEAHSPDVLLPANDRGLSASYPDGELVAELTVSPT